MVGSSYERKKPLQSTQIIITARGPVQRIFLYARQHSEGTGVGGICWLKSEGSFAMATNPRSTAQVGGHPIHPMVIAFPIACFVLTLVSDLTFYATSNAFWATASLWLLGIGLIAAAFASMTGLIDALGDRRVRQLSDTRLHAAGNAIALLIALYNWYARYEHGSSVVIPNGVVLSALVVLILLFTAWKGGEMVYRHRVGVAD